MFPRRSVAPASYRIEVGVSDLNLARTVPRNPLPVHGALQATLDLTRAGISALSADHGRETRRPRARA